MKLKGKVALITGANRGIGEGIAIEMAKQGADIAINYRSHADEAEKVAACVRDLGVRAIVCQADVGDRAAIDRIVKQTIDELGKVDICVANAARTIRKPFLELEHDDMQKVIDVSLLGVFGLTQQCARHMAARGEGGAILVISSVHAFIPFPTCTPYNTCKAAINHMAHTMAEELREHRIRVNVLEPGWIDTPGERETGNMDDDAITELGRAMPWGRMGTIDEMGKAATFLCSDDASYVNAATLRADGGFWLPSRGADSIDG